jgi:Spy/CpxP family protein refolding chaperone
MSRLKKFYLTTVLFSLFLAPAFAGAAEEPVQDDPFLPSDIEFDIKIDVDQMIEDMSKQAQLASELALGEQLFAFADEPEESDKNSRKRRDKHERRISMSKMMRIMEEVDLTDEQVDKFFPLWREVQKQERELSMERRKLARELKGELEKETPDESALRRLINSITEKSDQVVGARRKGMKKAMELMTVPQQARFILAVSQTERDIREMIFKARARGISPPDFDSGEFREKMELYKKKMEKFGEKMPKAKEFYEQYKNKDKNKDKTPEGSGNN